MDTFFTFWTSFFKFWRPFFQVLDIPFRVLDTIFQVLSIIFELPAITYILGEYVPNMKVWYFSEKEKLKFSLVEGQRARFVSWGSFGPHLVDFLINLQTGVS